MKTNKGLLTKLILLILVFFIIGIGTLYYVGSQSTNVVEEEERTFSGVEKVVVDSINLSVKIYESDVEQVTVQHNAKVRGLTTGKSNKIEQVGGVLTVKQEKAGFFFSYISGSIVVEIPEGSVLEYDINTISGNIDHDGIGRNTLTAVSISGEISIHQGGEKALVKSNSGSVKIHAPFEELSAKSISGSVSVVADQDSKIVTTSSVSGSVKIQLDSVLGYNMDYSTTSGSVKDTYRNMGFSKSGNATNGDSSLKIDASSISGSIKLVDWLD